VFAPPLALAASASWGLGDFLGGIKSRILSPLAVMAVSQPVGLACLALAVAVRGSGPPGADVLWACPAAVLGTVGLAGFYRGMATGAISIVAPIAGTAAVIPVVFGLATGDQTSRLQQAGFAVAIAGVVLSSWERTAQRSRVAPGVAFAAVALLGFGGYFVLMHEASGSDFLWPAFLFRIVSTTLVWSAVAALRVPVAGARLHLPVLAAIGLLDTGGNTLFAAASQRGAVSVVSVLASLYPVVTVLLARLRLHERVHRAQEAGIALTLAGIVFVSAG
jgi:drug/metabolite transporter (DMT)-like permease